MSFISKVGKYALRYTFIPETKEGGFSCDEAGDCGMADALLGISIIYTDDGDYSQAIFSFDGKEKRPLNKKEIFKAWMMLGLALHDHRGLKGWQYDTVEIFSKNIRAFIKEIKNKHGI